MYDVDGSDFDDDDQNKNLCSQTLQNLTMNFLTDNKTVYTMFRNSGKDYNDLGRFEDCNKEPDFVYILASVQQGLPAPLNLGLCVPKECSADDFNRYFKASFIAGINTLIPEIF